jgi:putative peptidoglycan lipid II flippase
MRTAAKTAALMAALTLGSKLLGFLREIFMASFFGTSYITDAYVMASAIPGILFAGVFGAVSVAYMPILSKTVEEKGIQEGNKFTSETITLTTLIAIVSAVVGILFSDLIVSLFARGFVGETAELTSFYVKITFSFVIFTGITGLLNAYQQYRGSFLRPIIAGYFQSGSILIFIIVSAYTTHYLLAFGWLIGSALYTIVTGYFAKKAGFSYRLTGNFGPTAKHIMVLALPVFLGSTISQINTFVDKMLASGLPEGSVAALNYSNLLIGLITALTITVINTIIYPRLTQAVAKGDMERFSKSIATGINIIVIIAVPFSLGAMLYSDVFVQIVYERGAFSAASTALTGPAFFYYAIGLTFAALNSLLVHSYYAMHNMKTPVVCGAVGAVVNITLNLLLVGVMAHRGLALATSVAAIVNTILLAHLLRRQYPEVKTVESQQKLGKIITSAFGAVGASWFVWEGMRMLFESGPRTLFLGMAVLVAGLVYLLLLKVFKVSELELLRGILKFR